ncbi:hypothetical protein V5O48_003774 [Marasmius crinis-equi]|uniref:Uncharacterized protein n=1 Tax=Marasmius crinis-equi TaxID=585013 RepID=A0ABR3FSF1_9AGAR
MSTLSASLRTFLRNTPEAHRRCFMMVYPNPRFWLGLKGPAPNEMSYLISFGRGKDEMIASGSKSWDIRYSKHYSYHRSLQDELAFSRWSSVLAASGKNLKLRETLIEVLNMFPEYDLTTENGLGLAASDIEEALKSASGGIVEAQALTLGSKVALA